MSLEWRSVFSDPPSGEEGKVLYCNRPASVWVASANLYKVSPQSDNWYWMNIPELPKELR